MDEIDRYMASPFTKLELLAPAGSGDTGIAVFDTPKLAGERVAMLRISNSIEARRGRNAIPSLRRIGGFRRIDYFYSGE